MIGAAAMDVEEYDFVHSPLSGPFTRNGHMVEVEIYRLACTRVARKPTGGFAPNPVVQLAVNTSRKQTLLP